MKTPLTTMLAPADVLAQNRESNLTPSQLTRLQAMQRRGRRLNRLVENRFDHARIETGGFRLDRREHEVKRLIDDQIAGFNPIIALKNQTLAARMREPEVWMDADPDRPSRIIANPLSNASKYSPGG
ncbi:MAG: HAMP domain-containing histidine kinase [SAR202 cluster bacterium]|nr:HAMP domain-containing histidine kinase [SAR202 cluster bacterium]